MSSSIPQKPLSYTRPNRLLSPLLRAMRGTGSLTIWI